MPELGVPRENFVFVSGIGCSSRFPYYMNTYGFHTIHGRAPAFATGIKASRPELSVWVVTGDGDGLSIGGNHLLHTIRRNVDLQILLFNNRVYGLTKGQYSPTSRVGHARRSRRRTARSTTRSTRSRSRSARAPPSSRARSTSTRTHLQEMLRRAHAHKGTAFIEILQNCPVYNDDEWIEVEDRKTRIEAALDARGRRSRWCAAPKGARRGIRIETACRRSCPWRDGEDPVAAGRRDPPRGPREPRLRVRAREPHPPAFPLPIGVFRAVEKPTYEALLEAQVDDAVRTRGPGDLHALLHSGDTWTVE